MAAKDTYFYLNEVGHELQLKKNHNCYFQVQGQLAISGKKFCDFVVWTLQGYSVERICFDPQLWQDMSQKVLVMVRLKFLSKLHYARAMVRKS